MKADVAGYIGLGDMGGPVARCLLRAGFPTVVYDIAPDRVGALQAQGAQGAQSPLDLARRANVVFLCVVNDTQVKSVFFGPDGLAGALDASKTIVINSSVRPETVREIGADPRLNGAALLDAPVSGSRPAAQAGTLTAMVGGDAAALAHVRPLFEAFCSTIFHVGPLGAGQSVKIANNIMLHMNHLISLEALRFARSQGIEERVLIEVANASTGRSWVTETWGLLDQMMIDHPQAGTASIYPLMSKELWNSVLISRETMVALPLTALGTQLSQSYFEERERDLEDALPAMPG
jgi:3-hydroxyisobutyrate dehydrogenase-like beta-hydroxyacid dehydrogenase